MYAFMVIVLKIFHDKIPVSQVIWVGATLFDCGGARFIVRCWGLIDLVKSIGLVDRMIRLLHVLFIPDDTRSWFSTKLKQCISFCVIISIDLNQIYKKRSKQRVGLYDYTYITK